MPVKAVDPDCSSPAVFVVQGALANAVVSELVAARGFTPADFKHHHPGGAIGASKPAAN